MLMRPLFRFVPDGTRIKFMRGRFAGLIVSAVLSTASVALFFYPGLRLGIDFSGGIVMELRTPLNAMETGFRRAYSTIIDSNATAFLAHVMLFIFGSGPVRGFATTLTIGLAANLFTAVFVSRVIFDWHLNRMKTGELVSI